MHIDRHEQLLNQLSTALKHHPEFEHAFSDFEARKVCYLPIGAFLLKPVQRLLHYHGLLECELVSMQYKLAHSLSIITALLERPDQLMCFVEVRSWVWKKICV